MPYRTRRHDGRWCVEVQRPDESWHVLEGGCHDRERDALRHATALRINVEAREGARRRT